MNAITPVTPMVEVELDPKLAFLARAAARFELVQSGEMQIDEAFDGLVVDLRCNCDCERVGSATIRQSSEVGDEHQCRA